MPSLGTPEVLDTSPTTNTATKTAAVAAHVAPETAVAVSDVRRRCNRLSRIVAVALAIVFFIIIAAFL